MLSPFMSLNKVSISVQEILGMRFQEMQVRYDGRYWKNCGASVAASYKMKRCHYFGYRSIDMDR